MSQHSNLVTEASPDVAFHSNHALALLTKTIKIKKRSPFFFRNRDFVASCALDSGTLPTTIRP